MDLLCRLCGQPSEKIRCKITDKALQIEQKLYDCCRWKSYKEDENLPEIVCISCFECLERSWQFCEKVAATQTHLKEIFSDWKPDSHQPMNPVLPSATIEPNVKDKFMDDDHSFEELPLNSWSEDEMDVGNLPQIKVEPLYLLDTATNDCQMSSEHPERFYTAETFDVAIKDNKKLKMDTNKFPQCLEPHERNADGTVNQNAVARLNLCDWSIFQHQCHECWMIFTDNAEMKRHYKQQHLLVKIRHKCWLCTENLSYTKRNTLYRHIRRHHIHHLALCCRYCNTHFWDSKLFKKHQKQKSKCQPQLKKAIESVVCEHCGLICSTLGNYKYHQYNKHLSNDLKPVFECFLCHLDVFDSRLKLKRHIALNHIGKKMVQCSICNCVMNKSSLARHKKIHSDETPFICSFAKPCGAPCGKAFKFSRGLEVHERIHRGHRPYKCRAEGCDYATSDGGNIYKHMKQKHKMVFPKKGMMNVNCETERRYKNALHSK